MHEISHIIQHKDMRNGKLDYLTYCFKKEEMIQNYDSSYYSKNYESIYTEIHARKKGLIGALEIASWLSPILGEEIISEVKEQYIEENNFGILKNSKKETTLKKEGLYDVSDYLGKLIQSYPEIIEKNPIYSIEYNTDGSRKTLRTILNEAKQMKQKCPEEFKKVHQIYYGIISDLIQYKTDCDRETQDLLSDFYDNTNYLVTDEAMRFYYDSVSVEHIEAFFNKYRAIINENLMFFILATILLQALYFNIKKETF